MYGISVVFFWTPEIFIMYLYLLTNEYKDHKTNGAQFKDRSQYSEILVRNSLLDYWTRQQLKKDVPEEAFAIERESGGKPFFTRLHQKTGAEMPVVHFSVSHSGTLWGCLMGAEPVGFDMEVCRQKIDYLKIARRFYATEEYNLVCAEGLDAFFEIWVRKEAYVKYVGSGLGEGLSTFSVAANGKFTDRVIAEKKEIQSNRSCVIRPCKIADGVKAAYCCGSGDTVKAVITLDPP